MPSKNISNQLLNAIGVDKNRLEVKLQQAPAIKQQDKGKFRVMKKFALVQADVIYMPTEQNGFKYILTVVDVASRHVDAIPMKGRQSADVVEAFEQVWKNKYIDVEEVLMISTDPGSEFKNADFKDYMKQLGISVRHSMTNRHQQMGIVEFYNHLFTKALGTKMTVEALESGEGYSTSWVTDLPKLVAILNKKENITEEHDISQFFKEPDAPKEKDLLQEGTVVHVRLQQPKDALTDKRLHGNFRNSDLRWEKELTEIVNVLLLPGQPNMRYMVKKYNNVSFIRKELLLATPEEIAEYRKKNPITKEAPKETPKKTFREPIKTRSRAGLVT
jgi:hypothetical protein